MRYRYFERSGAVFRAPEGYVGVTHVKSKGEWFPYEGTDTIAPVYFGAPLTAAEAGEDSDEVSEQDLIVKATDKRNVLLVDSSDSATQAVTPEMVEVVSERIRRAGGVLSVSAVLNEDTNETDLGDGFYLHVCGIALNETDATRLSSLAKPSPQQEWHVRNYCLELLEGVPSFVAKLLTEEEFTINDFVGILYEIPAGAGASRLNVSRGSLPRTPGKHMLELPPAKNGDDLTLR